MATNYASTATDYLKDLRKAQNTESKSREEALGTLAKVGGEVAGDSDMISSLKEGLMALGKLYNASKAEGGTETTGGGGNNDSTPEKPIPVPKTEATSSSGRGAGRAAFQDTNKTSKTSTNEGLKIKNTVPKIASTPGQSLSIGGANRGNQLVLNQLKKRRGLYGV